VTRFRGDDRGRFHVPLNPGTYTLRPESSGAFPHGKEQTVTVAAGRFTQVRIIFDSGIR
jgi:hypothetical protein